MINQDQNDLNVQQDFDEFDNLVNDDFDILEEMDGADTSDNRKKRQMIFYLVLFFMLAVGGGAAWFLFFRPADTVTPLPMPGSMNQAQETTTAPPALEGLPPGVMTPEENAQANLREATQQDADMASLPPALNEVMPPAAPSFDSTEQSMDQEHDLIDLPPAEIDLPVDGTLAEALPPPTMQAQPLLPDQAAQYEVMPPLPSSSDDMLPPQSPTEQSQAGQNPESEIIAPAPVTAAEFAPEMQNMVADPVVTPVVTPVTNATTLQLQQRVGEMENHIQNLTQELQQLRSNAQTAPAPQTSDISESHLQELNKKLDHLAQQVDALDQRTTTFATELQQRANSPAAAATTTEAPRQAASTPAPAAKPKTAATKPAPRKNAVSGWELRSAQPGVAWLGRQGANEMGRYAVGQNVPGLGTVQDVTQEGGRWIVKTSGGTLRQ